LLFVLFVAVALGCGSNYVVRSTAMRNQAVSYLPPSVAGQLVGIGSRSPCGDRQCSRCGSGLAYSTTTRTFGHITVTAHRGLVSVLANVFADLQRDNPTLFRRLGTAGAVCCRLIKLAGGGCASSWSNHAFGSAIDMTIDGIVDAHGDGCVHRGLVEAAPYFQRYQLYWGAGFSTEDAMHFEVSRQLAQRWISSGIPDVGAVAPIPSDPVPGGGNSINGPPCSYRGNNGACIATGSCRSARGQAFSSRLGANGCQQYPTDIQCCIAGSSLLEGETGDLTGDEIEVEEDPDAPALDPETIAAIVVGILIPLIIIVAIVLVIRARRNAASKVDVFASVQNEAYESARGNYTCATCQASFEDVSALTAHVATHN